MSYQSFRVRLSQGQVKTMAKAIESGSPTSIRLKRDALGDGTPLLFTRTQMNKIGKAMDQNRGIVLKFSMAQTKAMRKDGGILPALAVLAPFAIAALTGAAGAAGTFGTTKVLEAIEKGIKKRKGNSLAPLGQGLAPLGGCYCEESSDEGYGLAPFGYSSQKGRSIGIVEGYSGGKLFPLGVKDTRS